MSGDETTASRTVRSKRRVVGAFAAALVIVAVAYCFGSGERRPQQLVGLWTVASPKPGVPERRFEFLDDGTFWTYNAGVRRYEGTWDGTESELIVIVENSSSPRGATAGVLLERLAQFIRDPLAYTRTLKFAVAGTGDTLKLTPTEEFGRPPVSPLETTIKRLAE